MDMFETNTNTRMFNPIKMAEFQGSHKPMTSQRQTNGPMSEQSATVWDAPKPGLMLISKENFKPISRVVGTFEARL